MDLQEDLGHAIEHAADLRVVVDREHHPALCRSHTIGHPLVLGKREVDAVPLSLPVRRIQVVQRRRPIVALQDLMPGSMLDDHVG